MSFTAPAKDSRTELSRMLAGELYLSGDPALVALRRRAHDLCHRLNVMPPGDIEMRAEIIAELLGRTTPGLWIQPPFYCDYGTHITFGPDCYLNFHCVILDVCRVTIGARTKLGPGVQIYTATHPLEAATRRTHESGSPITIGEDVWIGGGAIVCPGITIGDRSVIGAGSVVTRDLPSDVLAVGNPCRVIRTLA